MTSGHVAGSSAEVRRKLTGAREFTAHRASQAEGAKTGVFTGAFATNPVNDQPIPIFVVTTS